MKGKSSIELLNQRQLWVKNERTHIIIVSYRKFREDREGLELFVTARDVPNQPILTEEK